MENLISLLRSVHTTSEEDLANAVQALSPATREELSAALSTLPQARPMFECSFCDKKFPRKWNRDRHVSSKHTRHSRFCCPFAGCRADDLTFETALLLVTHLASAHGLETAPSKRPRTGVRHDDHYDLLLPSGALLHVGEHGLEERALPRSGSAERELATHDHTAAELLDWAPVQHDGHMDMLVGTELHCMGSSQSACNVLDVIDMADGADWALLLATLGLDFPSQ